MNKGTHILLMGLGYKLGLKKLPYPPYSITIEATNRCNFKCEFCPQSNPQHMYERPIGDLSIDCFKEFIRQVKELRTGNNKISICLDGEPLLNSNFPEFIRISNENKLVPRFSTNGKLLTKKMINELLSFGRFNVSVDFTSQKEYFEGPRGEAGDFEIIRGNLQYLVKCAKTNKNIYVEINDTSNYSGEKSATSLPEMKGLMNNGHYAKNIQYTVKQFHNFLGHNECTTYNNNNGNGNKRICPYPWYQFAITWDGNVVICCRDTSGRTVLGNIFSKPIAEIWNDTPFQDIRKLHRDKHTLQINSCKKCDLPLNNDKIRWKPSYFLNKLKNQ